MKPIIECVRDFILTFPELKDGAVMIDYLSSDATEYVIESVPCDPFYKRYTDGGGLRQFQFLFASREVYSADISQLTENSAFYESFKDWILHTESSVLTPFLDGRTADFIEILQNDYVFDTDADTARYQMQFNLIYHE